MSKALMIALALCSLALGGFLLKAHGELKTEKAIVEDLRDEVFQMEQDLDECGDRNGELNQMNEELQYELEECQSSNEENESNADDSGRQNWYLQDDNSNLENRVRELEEELEECEDRLRDSD